MSRRARARARVRQAVRLGAEVIIGCGRREDDLALAEALRGAPVLVGLVLCGIEQAAADLGPAVLGWFGPSQWPPDGIQPGFGLPPGASYPAAQSAAAGILALEALARAGSAHPDARLAGSDRPEGADPSRPVCG